MKIFFYLAIIFVIQNPLCAMNMSQEGAELYIWPLAFKEQCAFKTARRKLLHSDDPQSLETIKTFAQNSHPPAYAALSSYFMKKEDWISAFETSCQGALLGHPICQRQSALFLIGDLIAHNDSTEKRYDQAFCWLQKAAQGIHKDIAYFNVHSIPENRHLWFADSYAHNFFQDLEVLRTQSLAHNNNEQNNEPEVHETVEIEESLEGLSDIFTEPELSPEIEEPKKPTMSYEEKVKNIFTDPNNEQAVAFNGEKAHQYLQEIETIDEKTKKQAYKLLFQTCLDTKSSAHLPKKDERKFAQFFYKIVHKMIDADLLWEYPDPHFVVFGLIDNWTSQQITNNQFELVVKLLKHAKKNPLYFDRAICFKLFGILPKLNQLQRESFINHESFSAMHDLANRKINPRMSLQFAEFVIKNEQTLIKTGNLLPNVIFLLQHANSDETCLKEVIALSFSEEKTRAFGLELLENYCMANKGNVAAKELCHYFVPTLEQIVHEKKLGSARAAKLLYFTHYAPQLSDQSPQEFIKKAKNYLEESLKTEDIDVYIANAAFTFGRSQIEQIDAQELLIKKIKDKQEYKNEFEAAWQRLKSISESCLTADVTTENAVAHVDIIAHLYRLCRIYSLRDSAFAQRLFLAAEGITLFYPGDIQKIPERKETISFLETLSQQNEGWASFLIAHYWAVSAEKEFIAYKMIKHPQAVNFVRKSIMFFEKAADYLSKAKQQGYYDSNNIFSIDKVYCKIGKIHQGLREFKEAYKYFQKSAQLQNAEAHNLIGDLLLAGFADVTGQLALEQAISHFIAAVEIEEKSEKRACQGKNNLLELFNARLDRVFPCGGMVSVTMKKQIEEFAERFNWQIAPFSQEPPSDDVLTRAKSLYAEAKYEEALILFRSLPASNLEALSYLAISYFNGYGVPKSSEAALDLLSQIFDREEYWHDSDSNEGKSIKYALWNMLVDIKKEGSVKAAYLGVKHLAFISVHFQKKTSFEKLLSFIADAEQMMFVDPSASAVDVLFTSGAMNEIGNLLQTEAYFSLVLPLARLFLERVVAHKLPSPEYREDFHQVFRLCDEILIASNRGILDVDKVFNSIDLVSWQEFFHRLKRALPIYKDSRLEMLLARLNTFLISFSRLNEPTKKVMAQETIDLLERIKDTWSPAKFMLCELYTHRVDKGQAYFPVNHKKAYQYLIELAKQDNYDALVELGTWHEMGERETDKNPKKAEEYYTRAIAIQPNIDMGHYHLTRLYFRNPALVNFDYQLIYNNLQELGEKNILCQHETNLYRLALCLDQGLNIHDLAGLCQEIIKSLSNAYATKMYRDDIILTCDDIDLDKKIMQFSFKASDAEKLSEPVIKQLEGKLKLIRGLHCMILSHLIENQQAKREQYEKGIGLLTESCKDEITTAALSLVTYESWVLNKNEIALRNGAFAAARQAAITNDLQNACYLQLKKAYTDYINKHQPSWLALEDLEKRYAQQ